MSKNAQEGGEKCDQKEEDTPVRTSVKLPLALDRNIEMYSVMKGLSKNDAMVELVSAQLIAKGFKPKQFPVMSYRELDHSQSA